MAYSILAFNLTSQKSVLRAFCLSAATAALLMGCTGAGQDVAAAPCQLAAERTLGKVVSQETLYFENVIASDAPCIALQPSANYQGHEAVKDLRTDDTQRVQQALFSLSSAQGNKAGGILYLRASENGGNNMYRLSRLTMPSNIRVVIDPEVTLVMIGGDVPRRHMNGDIIMTKTGKAALRKNQFIFTIGNSEFPTELNPERTENVEITSARKGEMYTIDQRTEFPVVYTYRKRGELRSGRTVVSADDPQEYGITSEFAAPFYIGYAHNISVSDVNVLDNYTYLPPVALFPDSDMQDGIIGAKRYKGKKALDAKGNQLLPRMLIDDEDNKVTDMSAYTRNATFGRTASQGAFINIKGDRGHGGFGLFQLWGGHTMYVKDLEGTGGITVRLEPGAGIENISRSGPDYGTIHTVEIENISIRDGYSALWLNPHSKDNYNIKAKNLSAYDSGAVVIMDKSSQDTKVYPDLYQGKFSDVEISGKIHFAREHAEPRAEVGFIPTLAMHTDAIANVTDKDGYTDDGLRSGQPDGKITTTDLVAGPSGDRWFMVDPIMPIIAFNQFSDASKNTSNVTGLYEVDFSKAEFTRGGAHELLHKENIAYREDMRRLGDGKPALSRIHK